MQGHVMLELSSHLQVDGIAIRAPSEKSALVMET
jgi:hypothetical protein